MQNLLKSVLTRANLKAEYQTVLLSRESLYVQAFTSKTYDPVNNYEMYELLGDSTANKFLAWYFYRRFPQLHCPEGVKVMARLKINYASKQSFSRLADSLGFWPFIRASDIEKNSNRKSLLEDSLEAFIGLTEMLLDEHFTLGVGYAIVYDILKSLFDQIDISLEYDRLYDAKTRLKELFDKNSKEIGTLVYEDTRDLSRVFAKMNGQLRLLGSGKGNLQGQRQQAAAAQALEVLKLEGYTRVVAYELLCE